MGFLICYNNNMVDTLESRPDLEQASSDEATPRPLTLEQASSDEATPRPLTLKQVSSNEVTPRPFTITDFLRILEEPVVIEFLVEKLGLTLEGVQKQLRDANHQPLTFEEQRQLTQNRIEAEKQVALREGRRPSLSNYEHGLGVIGKREGRNDETDYYGVVRTPKDLMESPTGGEMAAEDKILEFYGF